MPCQVRYFCPLSPFHCYSRETSSLVSTTEMYNPFTKKNSAKPKGLSTRKDSIVSDNASGYSSASTLVPQPWPLSLAKSQALPSRSKAASSKPLKTHGNYAEMMDDENMSWGPPRSTSGRWRREQ